MPPRPPGARTPNRYASHRTTSTASARCYAVLAVREPMPEGKGDSGEERMYEAPGATPRSCTVYWFHYLRRLCCGGRMARHPERQSRENAKKRTGWQASRSGRSRRPPGKITPGFKTTVPRRSHRRRSVATDPSRRNGCTGSSRTPSTQRRPFHGGQSHRRRLTRTTA
jgi:hypothetical protein